MKTPLRNHFELSATLLVILLFSVFKVDVYAANDTVELKGKKLDVPNQTYVVKTKPGKNRKITISNRGKTQIAVKLDIVTMPVNAQLKVTINGEIVELDWQEGQQYIFKTTDNSGHCVVDMIGELQTNQTEYGMDVYISYQELTNGDFTNVDDKLTYLNSVLIAQEDKYINQPMSVLISDLDKYQLNFYQWIPSGATIDGVKTSDYTFRIIGLYFDPIVYIAKHPEIKFLKIQVLLNQSYMDTELKFFLTPDDVGEWNQNSKDYLGNKIVQGFDISVYGN